MATKQIQLQNTSGDILHPETEIARIVGLQSALDAKANQSTTQTEINNIKNKYLLKEADGSADTSYARISYPDMDSLRLDTYYDDGIHASILLDGKVEITADDRAEGGEKTSLKIEAGGVYINGGEVAKKSDIPTVDTAMSSSSTNPVQNKVVNTAISNAQTNAVNTANSNADSKISTHNTSSSAHQDIRTLANKAQSKADSAYALAEGRAKAVVFDTVSAMTSALKSASNTAYKVGDNIFIKDTDVPDYWISAVLSTNTGTYGYYQISPLETQKVDLSDYVTLDTNQDITGAKTFRNNVMVSGAGQTLTISNDNISIPDGTQTTRYEGAAVVYNNGFSINTLSFPARTGTLATTNQIPTRLSDLENDLGNYITYVEIS